MKIWFILMQFPNPREVFANNDVEMLRWLDQSISVHSLRKKHKFFSRIVKERNIKVDLTHNSIINSIIGILCILFYPRVFFSLLCFTIFHNVNSLNHLIKSIILIPRVIQLYAVFIRKKPDIIHLYWSHYPSLLGYLIKKFHPETVLTMTFVAYDLHQRYKGSIIVAKMADHVFSINKFDENTLIELGIDERKIDVIHHGLMPDLFRKQTHMKIPRRITSAGAFIPGKNMQEVIMVFSYITKLFPDASLVLIGDGPTLTESKKLATKLKMENINFTGHVSHEEVIKKLSESEIFLFLSDNERLPNVVKEAMSQKCICVVYQTPGIDELIISKDYGFVVKSFREAEHYTVKILQNTQQYKYMVDNAYNYVERFFNNEKIIADLIEIWHKTIKEKK